MAYPSGSQRLERRTGRSAAIATARPGVVTVIPAGSTSRWDIHQPMHAANTLLNIFYNRTRRCRFLPQVWAVNIGDNHGSRR